MLKLCPLLERSRPSCPPFDTRRRAAAIRRTSASPAHDIGIRLERRASVACRPCFGMDSRAGECAGRGYSRPGFSCFPAELSLGLACRVAIARAFAIEPDLLLFDERFVSLDAALAQRLRDELVGLSASERRRRSSSPTTWTSPFPRRSDHGAVRGAGADPRPSRSADRASR